MSNEQELQQLKAEIEQLKIDLITANTKIEAYRNASAQVVNLAFGLIASGTVAVIVSTVLRR